MKSPLKRRVAIATLLLAPVLTACGFDVQTDQVYQPATGVNDHTGAVQILNAQIVSAAEGSGTFIATLANNGAEADRLVSVTGDGVTATTKGVDVPAGGVANLAEPGKAADPIQVQVDGDDIAAGKWVRLTFAFADGQSTEFLVPVVSAESDDYDGVPLPSAASETPTESSETHSE